MTEPWCHELPPPQLLEGVEQFNRGEYFEQHETLEVLWRAEARPVRRLYQGILQIGVAFYHLQRHNYHGVVYMLTRGSAHLQPFAPACQRIDVASLIELAASTLRVVEQLGPTRLDEFPWEPKPSVRVAEYETGMVRPMHRIAWMVVPALVLALPGCAARATAPAPTAGRPGILEVREGLASYYGPGFDGRTTASGVRFDMNAMVAAHPTYPFGTVVRVTNLANNRAVEVRILDRGPAQGPRAAGVIVDLSYGAAQALGFIQDGLTRVRLEVLRWGD